MAGSALSLRALLSHLLIFNTGLSLIYLDWILFFLKTSKSVRMGLVY